MTCDRPLHLLLYGPPAAGKKTIGKALSAISGYPLIDNHLTGDIGRRIFPRDARVRAGLVDNLRLEIARAAAAGGVNIITTWMFDPAIDRLVADRLAEAVQAGGGVIFRIRLLAPPSVLMSRVGDRSRWAKDAIRDPTELERQLHDRDLFEPIAHDDLALDTSTGEAGNLAKRIWRELRPS